MTKDSNNEYASEPFKKPFSKEFRIVAACVKRPWVVRGWLA